MSPIRLRRTLPAVTLLTALLFTPTLAQARPSGPDRQAAVASSSFLGSLWHLLTSFWGEEGGSIAPWGGKTNSPGAMHSLWGAEGPSIDPWGGHAAPPTGGSPSGGSIDPNG
ncbi:MAG TPA: hypothetical protein VFE33_35450 [Thermoanaerobaculia bacterium]|nr:hypothetical protein [Thermoanaerobaculia bacterium]